MKGTIVQHIQAKQITEVRKLSAMPFQIKLLGFEYLILVKKPQFLKQFLIGFHQCQKRVALQQTFKLEKIGFS
jgi:hypothetical protein